jgi:hypothetical protein
MARIRVFSVGLCLLVAFGCAFGPKALEQSHIRYNNAVKHVTEEQLLLNLVRLRYNDDPMRLDVSGIAAQYELTGSVEARPFFSTQAARVAGPSIYDTFAAILPFVGASTANRPTISLVPLDDPETIRSLFRPSTAEGIAFLSETAWPVSTIFRLWVEYLNDVPNAPTASGPPRGISSPFESFRRATDLLQVLQDRGDVHFANEEKLVEVGGPFAPGEMTPATLVNADKEGYESRRNADGSWTVYKKGQRLILVINPAALASAEVWELCQLLRLKPGLSKYDVTVGGVESQTAESRAGDGTRLHIVPRSTVEALFYMSNGVSAPAEHVACGYVMPVQEPNDLTSEPRHVTEGLFTAHCWKGWCRPKCAWIAVKYRDYWYYIDDADNDSKVSFTLMMVMARANLLSTKKGSPVLTLPIGR